MEIWKDIKGYEGEYQVSNLGRVKSLDRKVENRFGRKMERQLKGKFMKPRKGDVTGHRVVTLRNLGVRECPYVHHLVMEAFVGKRPKGLVTCHNDGDPENNRLDNLRYDTARNNVLDVYKHGRKTGKGTLTVEQALEVKRLLKEKELSQRDIAKKFGVSFNCISFINTGKTYSWLDDNGDWRDVK